MSIEDCFGPMEFDEAFGLLKQGGICARESWEGSPINYVFMQPGYPEGVALNEKTLRATGLPEGTTRKIGPYLMASCLGNEWLVPYTPSNGDLFAKDWYAAA